MIKSKFWRLVIWLCITLESICLYLENTRINHTFWRTISYCDYVWVCVNGLYDDNKSRSNSQNTRKRKLCATPIFLRCL